jgi:TonB family protein
MLSLAKPVATPDPVMVQRMARGMATRTNPPPANVSALPSSADSVLRAVSTTAPWPVSCPDPQSYAAVVEQAVTPGWPVENGQHVAITRSLTSLLDVSVSASGSVDSVEVFQPSGVAVIDEAASAAARQSTYHPGMVLCRPAPGHYLFKVEFDT